LFRTNISLSIISSSEAEKIKVFLILKIFCNTKLKKMAIFLSNNINSFTRSNCFLICFVTSGRFKFIGPLSLESIGLIWVLSSSSSVSSIDPNSFMSIRYLYTSLLSTYRLFIVIEWANLSWVRMLFYFIVVSFAKIILCLNISSQDILYSSW